MNMKIPKYSRWMLPVSMLVSPLALAIEPPADDAAPPAVAEEAQKVEQAEAVGYLGLVSGPIPEVLSTHLGVRNGEGVLVRSVMPDGPAALAGIKKNDVIITIDGKSALSHAELSNIVRAHKPGTAINVGLIQEGKGTDLTVTLGKRPDQLARAEGRPQMQMQIQPMDGMPEEMAERIREMIEGNMMQFRLNGQELDLGPGNLKRDMNQMREQMEELRQQQQEMLKGGGALNFNANSTIRLMDNDGSIEMSTNNGEKKLIVRDKDNNIEWQGPWNNDEDKAAAPEEIRERAGKLNFDANGFKMQIGPGR